MSFFCFNFRRRQPRSYSDYLQIQQDSSSQLQHLFCEVPSRSQTATLPHTGTHHRPSWQQLTKVPTTLHACSRTRKERLRSKTAIQLLTESALGACSPQVCDLYPVPASRCPPALPPSTNQQKQPFPGSSFWVQFATFLSSFRSSPSHNSFALRSAGGGFLIVNNPSPPPPPPTAITVELDYTSHHGMAS